MRMKKWMGVLGLAVFMAVGIPGNAGSGLSMTAQAAGSGEMAGNVRVFDQADLFLEEEEKELQQAIDALREKMGYGCGGGDRRGKSRFCPGLCGRFL